MSPGEDFYRVLGLSRDATPEEIRAAYFDAARMYHPDVNPEPSAKERFLVIQQAYEILADVKKRVTYDASLPPETPLPNISVNVKYSRSIIPIINEPQLVYGMLEIICTAKAEKAKRPPIHLCLVVDKSTSMMGERMDMVQANLSQLFKQLKPQDMITIAAFSDRAEVLVPPTRASDFGRYEQRLSLLRPSGGTEIFQGLEVGLNQLKVAASSKMIKHLILLTDGHTYGDEERCLELATQAAHDNVAISGLGIGHEWNDEFLDKIASLTGGYSVYVKTPKDLTTFLDQKFSTMDMVYLKGMKFDYVCDDEVELRLAYRIFPDVGPLEIKSPIHFGDLYYGKSITILFEFLVKNIPRYKKMLRLIEGRLDMQSVEDGNAAPRLFLKLKREVSTNPDLESPPAPVVEAMARLSMYRLQERARKEVEAGDIGTATRHLQHLATHLLASGDRELARTVLVEIHNIQHSKKFSENGDKLIKYGTRSLLLPSEVEER
jgi:Ca-activated chloride channel family protein